MPNPEINEDGVCHCVNPANIILLRIRGKNFADERYFSATIKNGGRSRQGDVRRHNNQDPQDCWADVLFTVPLLRQRWEYTPDELRAALEEFTEGLSITVTNSTPGDEPAESGPETYP